MVCKFILRKSASAPAYDMTCLVDIRGLLLECEDPRAQVAAVAIMVGISELYARGSAVVHKPRCCQARATYAILVINHVVVTGDYDDALRDGLKADPLGVLLDAVGAGYHVQGLYESWDQMAQLEADYVELTGSRVDQLRVWDATTGFDIDLVSPAPGSAGTLARRLRLVLS